MSRLCCVSITLAFLISSWSAARAQRADAHGIDGVYVGKIGMQLDNAKGKTYQAPAKIVLFPDYRSALLTAQHPQGVLVVVIKGELRRGVFYGTSRGRLDYGGYTQAMRWDISFDPNGETATLHGRAVNLPSWAHDDDDRYVFRKQRAKPRGP